MRFTVAFLLAAVASVAFLYIHTAGAGGAVRDDSRGSAADLRVRAGKLTVATVCLHYAQLIYVCTRAPSASATIVIAWQRDIAEMVKPRLRRMTAGSGPATVSACAAVLRCGIVTVSKLS